MINILTYATNKRYAIAYFLEDGYMSDRCFFNAKIKLNDVDNIGRSYLIAGRATKKILGTLKKFLYLMMTMAVT